MRKLGCSGWSIASSLIVLFLCTVFFDFVYQLFQPLGDNWQHVKSYMLYSYIQDTLIICVGVGVGVAIVGTSLAWIVSVYSFPGSRFLPWLLFLPLSIPPYIGAYTYSSMFSYTGIVQKLPRNYGWGINTTGVDIMNLKGAIFMFILFLLPYVYIVVSSYLQKQSAAYLESARLLGANEGKVFLRVLVPLARGQIVAGTTLALLEVLSDYGVVSYFGLGTLSTAIFTSWIGLGDITLALRMAAILLLTVIGVIIFERWSRRRVRYHGTTTKTAPLQKKNLSGAIGWLAAGYAYGYVTLAFFIPLAQLVYWASLSYENILTHEFWTLAVHSVAIAGVSSLIVVFISIIIANYHRLERTRLSVLYSNITLFGYSVPGTVIAIIMVVFFVDLDRLLAPAYKIVSPQAPTLWLSMSLGMLITGYVIRFLGVAFQPIEGGFEKMGKDYHEAGKLLGAGGWKTFWRVDLPMLKPALLSAFALSFVEIVKELPLALFLRPFNFHTLATRVFNYANDEQIIEGAIPSLCIICISGLFMGALYHYTREEERL